MSTARGFSQGGRPAKCFNVHLLSSRLLYCCFVDILVSRSLRRTPFRVCFNRHSAIMLPTHDELVLIVATNQPAVQAVDEAVGTSAVPGTPAQTPLSATLAWVGIPSDAWNAFNEELGGVTRVRDVVNISTTDWENAIAVTSIATQTGIVSLKPLHRGQLGSVRSVCRLLMNLPVDHDPQRRAGTHPVPDEEGVTVAKRTDESGAGLGTRKVCMRTVLDQRDDYEIPIMDAAAVRALHARFVASNDNVEPESDEECDGAQLQAVKSKLDADVVPYADFGVFGPLGARFAKIVKYTAQVWDPTTCTYTPKKFKGPRTLDEWRVHWRVYSFALLCFGAVDRARLQQYACHNERLHSDYSNIPGGGWWIIAVADVRMRSEHMEKLRRRAEQAYVSNPESGFDPAPPWDWVFALAARDRDFCWSDV